jgi:predicted AlkP superfamily phosphohydrolase/phosphomutase
VAFSLDTGRVFLNVRGRQPEGCVAPEDAPRLRDEIAAGLEKLEIRVPWSAQPFRPIARVFRREEIYRGPFTALAGDLILHPADGYELKSSFHHPALSGLRNFTGMHTFDRATLFLRGRRWPERTPRIIDLAPTILRLMQLPVPDELEGLA